MWRRRDDADNPAWPGLVDIFAFTLAFLLIIWFANNFPQKVENLEKEARDLSARLNLLAGEKQNLQDLTQSLREQLAQLTQTNLDLSGKVKILEDNLRDLDAQRASLQSANFGLSSQVERLSQENATLRDVGRKDWQELLRLLQNRLAGMPLTIVANEQEKEIEIHGKPNITFETLKYELAAADKQRLKAVAPILSELRRQKKFFITINGTADPREVHSASPPRSNAELSALRAATVAALLENASPGLGRSLRVMGLGVKGREKALAPGEDPEKLYKDYRTVSLVLKIDVAALMQGDKAGQTD
ncbi:MAG: OmpA family protein [Deltaproteobacteria bacterium]|nr:OmpA family protein [Deltaproteobacteria bacterium]